MSQFKFVLEEKKKISIMNFFYYLIRNSVKRTVIFAEPVTGNTNKQLDAALLPGDRLLEVNGQNVQNTNREDIIDIIRNSGSSVTLKVVVGNDLSI